MPLRGDKLLGIHVSPSAPDMEAAVLDTGARLESAEFADGIVCVHDDVEWLRGVVGRNKGLRWVQLGAAGIDQWLDADVMRPTITWTAAKGVHATPMAEHVIALVYCAAKGLAVAARRTRWGELAVSSVAGSVLGVVGAGLAGRAIVDLARANGMQTIALTRRGGDTGADVSLGANGLSWLLARADIVVQSCPLTDETRGMIGDREFAGMKRGAWLINVGRGAVVDTDALLRALDGGRLAGALLDVTDPEPLPSGHALWARPNVLITPHVASTPAMGRPALVALVAENTRRLMRGDALIGVVDLVAGY